ncbi:MAG: MASE3 domain-containing protein [Promethearchaeia archaeon]
MRKFSNYKKVFTEIGLFILILIGVSLTRLHNYLLFHTIVESYSIFIALVIFIFAWTTRKEIDNSFFLVLSISSMFVAILDFIHTLVFPGMNIITGSNTNLASQFWIATRFLQVFSILGSIWAINKKVRPNLLMLIYSLITSVLIIMIFSGFFPVTYSESTGLTPFKITSEYIIILIILVAIFLIYYFRNQFEKNIYYLIEGFLVTLIISEFSFTLYLSAYELPNLMGHIFKIVAFYFLYKSIIQIGLKNPVQLLFRKLNLSKIKFENAYNRANFLMNLIAHDINNILQVIQFGVENSKNIVNSSDKNKSLEESLQLIENQVRDGSKLVKNVINLSKLEDKDIIIKKVEINQILEEKVAQVMKRYQDRDLTIKIKATNEHMYAYANDLLGEVFDNLLVNAIKHNRDMKLEILIRVTRDQRKDKSYIKIEFIDNGKGIEDSRKETLFKGDLTPKESIHGMGLGLSLVKRIIDLFKGKIWIEDRVKGNHTKGCNFIILIPEASKMRY